MMKVPTLVMLLLLSSAVECNSPSPPGKPVLLGCRCPNKEIFYCWWEPGSDGGLPTTHRLYYKMDNLEKMHQCPDYHTAGGNSCFFNKNYTSIWVDYYLTVVAFNALGNASSDPLTFDIMKILKPHSPENVTLMVNIKDNPYLHITWQRPSDIGFKSGWVTLTYELRIKQDNSNNWKNYPLGTETELTFYSISPGVVYVVQVRCAIDHGTWSEWSNTTSVKIPKYPQNEKPFWLLVFSLSAIPLLAAMCVLVMKRKKVKQCLLPPVPGPKIRGVDVQLLKSGRSEDVINAMLVNHNFPAMKGWKDQTEEYLIVSDKDTWLLPDPLNSQKMNKMFIVPVDLITESVIPCQKSTPSQSNSENAEERKEEEDHFVKSSISPSEEILSNMDPSQLLTKCRSVNLLNSEAVNQNTIQPFGNSGYVDIQRHENMQEADYSKVNEVNGENIFIMKNENVPHTMDTQGKEGRTPDDYSRVKEVGSDNMVFLQKHSDPVNCSFKGTDSSDWINQKPKNPHVTGASEVGVCTELTGCGYVDTVSVPCLT